MKKIICLDPGHGPTCGNCSPDKTYYEYEFAWDMYKRIKYLLEKQGFKVVCTKTEKTRPLLSKRAEVSNRANADLFVSLHSNAASSGWSSPSGLMIFTTSGPMTASRNKVAQAIVSEMSSNGVKIWSNAISHRKYTVLVKTSAPAILIEYGFHTNKVDTELLKTGEYRNKLAICTVKGICDYFNADYVDPNEDKEEGLPDAPSVWAEKAWGKAKNSGIMDGTRPKDTITRQEIAMILERLNLLKE